MPKKQFLAKLNKIDYNNALEEILEHKSFTSDTKSLLLSMLYKIEISYNDYIKVKRYALPRNKLIEEIIETIKEKCEYIKLVEPKSELGEELISEDKVARVNGGEVIALPTEYALLTAISEMMESNFNSNNILSKEIKKIMQLGYALNIREIIYNFDGWTWNRDNIKDENFIYSLIYNNILFLLNIDFIEEWRKTEQDYINVAKDILFREYSGESQIFLIKELIKVLAKGLINDYPEEEQQYVEKLEELRNEFNIIDDTNRYLSEISEQKKRLHVKIKEIDVLLLDKNLLKDKYESENEKRPLEKKIFSIRHYETLLKKEKEELIQNISDCNKLIEPVSYVEKKEDLKDEISKYEIIENAKKEVESFEKLVLEFQGVFLKVLSERIDKAINKKDIIDLIYILRYYKNMKIEKSTYIMDIEELKNSINIFERELLFKACNSEVFNKLTENMIYTIDILTEILNTKIIDLEDIYIIPKVVNNLIVLDIYDGEVYDTSITLDSEIKVIQLKQNKKTRLFN